MKEKNDILFLSRVKVRNFVFKFQTSSDFVASKFNENFFL